MKETVDNKSKDNSSGIVGVVFGILSIIFLIIPFIGLALGIVGLIFSFKQNKYHRNKWSVAGLWLCWIGVIVGAIWSVYYVKIMIDAARYYQGLLAAQQAAGASGIDLSSYGAN